MKIMLFSIMLATICTGFAAQPCADKTSKEKHDQLLQTFKKIKEPINLDELSKQTVQDFDLLRENPYDEQIIRRLRMTYDYATNRRKALSELRLLRGLRNTSQGGKSELKTFDKYLALIALMDLRMNDIETNTTASVAQPAQETATAPASKK
jgi:hypothetical protein